MVNNRIIIGSISAIVIFSALMSTMISSADAATSPNTEIIPPNGEIGWEDKKFLVEMRTLTEISSFNFDQPTKSGANIGNSGTTVVPMIYIDPEFTGLKFNQE